MIQFHFKKLLAEKEFNEKRTISIREVAKKTSHFTRYAFQDRQQQG